MENEGERQTNLSTVDSNADQGEGSYTQEFVDEAIRDSVRWVIWYLRRLVQAGDIYSRQLNKEFQVSQPQLSCLLALHEYGPLSLSRLAKYILVKPSTVTGIIDRLEQKKLVTRMRSSLDRRVITIELTERGKLFVAAAPPPIPKPIAEGLQKLSPAETQHIVKSLSTLVAMLEEDTTNDHF